MEKVQIINKGKQGMIKEIRHEIGVDSAGNKKFDIEKKKFPVNTTVTCSKVMAEYLLKKYSDSTMAIYFKNPNVVQQAVSGFSNKNKKG